MTGSTVASATTITPGTAIDIRGLTKSYGDHAVLRGLDLQVPRGSVVALLGANGAGKTTVVRILATLLRPDGGTAVVDGHDVVREPGRVRASISLTGQSAAVDGVLTGRENLELIGELRRVPDPRGTASDLLATFGLSDAAHRPVSTYSGGMRRRLDIALGLVDDPAVLFLDEPSTGLDPQARLDVWALVRELADHGTTVLLTTQYLEEAEQLADRIAILHDGRVLVEGTLAELRAELPPATVEYVEKQPSLEDVFLTLTGSATRAGGSS